jgi:hypothetical protein
MKIFCGILFSKMTIFSEGENWAIFLWFFLKVDHPSISRFLCYIILNDHQLNKEIKFHVDLKTYLIKFSG